VVVEKRIRVFHLIKGLGRGGAEKLLSEGLAYADRQRFSYTYGYFLPWKDALVDELKAQGADVYLFRSRNSVEILLRSPRVAQVLRKCRADLLHCHLPLAGVVGRLAGRFSRIPVVYTEHNVLERHHRLTRWANLLTWRMQRKVIAVSNEVSASILQSTDHSTPVQVIQNGVNVEKFSPEKSAGTPVRGQRGIPLDAMVVGTIAVFTPKKRLDDWLRAALEIHQAYRGVRFLIVGDGPLRPELKSLNERLGLDQVVHFAGLQEDVRPYLAAMDIYMMSSQFEGLPIALLEAMAMELPVVGTSVGGIPEVVVEGKTGLLVPPGEPAQITSAVLKLLEMPDARRSMGQAGRKLVSEKFGMERMIRELEAVYLEVLATAPRRQTQT